MWQDVPNALTIAHTIQLAVAPVFLLSGLGALLNVFAGRLARAIDRSRTLEAAFNDYDSADRPRVIAELKVLDRRIRLIFLSILMCTLSAMAVCLVVSLLFVSRLSGGGYGRAVAFLFIGAMALLVLALFAFLIEVYLANRSTHRRNDLIEQAGGRLSRW